MDIDEFLDRELADSGLDKDEDSLQPEFNSEDGKSPVFQGDNAVDRTSLEQAEQSYIQLWNVLAQQKLKWNKDLYDQLYSISRQVSSELTQAFEEVKKKANQIYSLISRARASLKEGKKDMPMKLYAEMQEINNSIPPVFFEEKKAIQEQIILFYRELVNTTDSELSKRIADIVAQIMRLLESTDNSLRSGNIDDASSNYIRCADLFTQIPEGFLKTRNSIGMRLLDIYRTLSIQAEISDLQKQLGSGMQASQQRSPPRVYTRIPQKPSTRIPELAMPSVSEDYQPKQQKKSEKDLSSKETVLNKKREHAKKNIKKGFYNEAWKDVEEALQIEPNDVESKALKAKIKTLQ